MGGSETGIDVIERRRAGRRSPPLSVAPSSAVSMTLLRGCADAAIWKLTRVMVEKGRSGMEAMV